MPLQPYRNVGQVDPNYMGIGAVQNIQKVRNNDLLNIGKQKELDEFDANAPVRDAARRTSLDAAELQSITDGAVAAMPFIQAGDDAGLLRNVQSRYQSLVEQGRDPSDTLDIMNMLQSGDTGQMAQAKEIITAIATQEQNQSDQNDPAAVAEYKFVQGLRPEERKLYMETKRANQIVMVGKVPHIMIEGQAYPLNTPEGQATLAREAGAAATIKGAEKSAELGAQIDLEPTLKSVVAQAEATATASADLAKEKKGNDKTFAIYDVGMTKLMEALGNTDTGPFVGRIPAVTTNQQISDASIAAMAPVMKQMFRAAGEGIFTDKDQELLMKMIPDRKLSPEARASAFQGIDAIVRAKLGIPYGGSQEQTTTQPTTATDNQYPVGTVTDSGKYIMTEQGWKPNG